MFFTWADIEKRKALWEIKKTTLEKRNNHCTIKLKTRDSCLKDFNQSWIYL